MTITSCRSEEENSDSSRMVFSMEMSFKSNHFCLPSPARRIVQIWRLYRFGICCQTIFLASQNHPLWCCPLKWGCSRSALLDYRSTPVQQTIFSYRLARCSDCHGLRNPCGSRVGSVTGRVRVGYFQPLVNPYPHHGLAVTREKTRSQRLNSNSLTRNSFLFFSSFSSSFVTQSICRSRITNMSPPLSTTVTTPQHHNSDNGDDHNHNHNHNSEDHGWARLCGRHKG